MTDSAVAHLTGALGKPIWVLLNFVLHWLWLLDRPDSLWYPTMRLFRQRAWSDWTRVFDRAAAALWQLADDPREVGEAGFRLHDKEKIRRILNMRYHQMNGVEKKRPKYIEEYLERSYKISSKEERNLNMVIYALWFPVFLIMFYPLYKFFQFVGVSEIVSTLLITVTVVPGSGLLCRFMSRRIFPTLARNADQGMRKRLNDRKKI